MHPGGAPNCPDWVMAEGYSRELSSCGFWPGNAAFPEAAFYAYAYPSPAGYERAQVAPEPARWDSTLGEFVLPYEAVRGLASPDEAILDFLQSTYAAAADLAHWDRTALERQAKETT